MHELTESEILEIERRTRGQSLNGNWFAERKLRLTGSRFGTALRLYEKSTNVAGRQRLIREIQGLQSVPDTAPIRWGRDHEAVAIEAYRNQSWDDVRASGLWVFPSGVLAASPDALVYRAQDHGPRPTSIVEVKCPYSVRDQTFSEMQRFGSLPKYLMGDLSLKIGTDYWHQIQGQLAATQAYKCDFIVWTTRDMLVRPVYKDPYWEQVYMPRLHRFYNEDILPALDPVSTL